MFRALASIGAIQIVIMLVGLVRSKVLSVLLGPAQFGVVSTIDQTVMTIVTLSALSLPFTALKFMSNTHSQGHELFQRTYSSFLRTLSCLAVGGAIAAAAVLTFRPGLFGEDLAHYRQYLLVGVLAVPALALHIFFVNTLAAAQASTASAGLSLAVSALLAAAAVIGAVTHGLAGLYVLSVTAGLVSTAMTLAYLRRRLGLRICSRAASIVRDLRENPEIVTQSAFFYAAMSAYALGMLATRYVTFASLGELQAGLLQAQMSLALTVGAVVAPMSNLYLAPLVNRRNTVVAKMRAADDFAGKIAILLLFGAMPVVLFPRFAITVLFSTAFAPAAQLLFLFILWQCLFQIVYVYMQLLIGADDVAFMTLATCASYIVAGALFPVLIPIVGTAGAAIALIAGLAGAGTAAVLRLRLKFNCAVGSQTWCRSAYALLVIVLGGMLFPTASEWTRQGITARVAYGIAATGVLLWKGLTNEERGVFRRTLSRAPAAT